MDSISFKAGESISHAYILADASERDRAEKSRALAAAMLCEGGGERPCGVCRQCRKVFAGIHPDVVSIERGIDDKGRKKRDIQIWQVRFMVSDAQVMPNEAARKVYIVSDADAMNAPAQNAFLKLLEEPPGGASFILCAANPALLLPTVRSRCVTLRRNSEQDDGADMSSALRYLELAAAGDRAALLRWCFENEGMEPRAAEAFIRACRQAAADVLCGRGGAKLAKRECMRLDALFTRCADYLRQNTGVKHIFGLLAVHGIPATTEK